jgi:hypothetical protein
VNPETPEVSRVVARAALRRFIGAAWIEQIAKINVIINILQCLIGFDLDRLETLHFRVIL